jgi:hypothetical protein
VTCLTGEAAMAARQKRSVTHFFLENNAVWSA